MDSSLLTTLDGRHRFVDTFDALLSRWQTVAGTLTVSGGALQASALGDWGNNLVTNGEFTTDAGTWIRANLTSISRVDSGTDPGASSGGTDDWCGKNLNSGSGTPYAYQDLTVMVGATYAGRCRAYAPSTNTTVNAARLFLSDGIGGPVYVTAENAWQTLTSVSVPTVTSRQIRIMSSRDGGSYEAGDVAYFDAVVCYRQNAAAIRNVAPAFRARLAHISPAAPSVVPAGWIFRYTDALNYWELRVLPNTDGNDMQIVQVTAGAETVRAEADVGWTAEGTDEVELIVRGSSITTRYRKAGGVWTAGPSYASATQGAQARAMGPLVYGTTTARWARVEVDW